LKRVGGKNVNIMKKVISVLLISIFVSQVIFAQEKTIIGLTNEEISQLESNNLGLRINLNNYDYSRPQFFSDINSAQLFLDSMKSAMSALINTSEQQIQVANTAQGRFAACGCGDYIANVGSAGLFSSFNVSFSYCNGSVSNANINVTGLQIGWSWGNTTSSYNGLYGCSFATATFGIGIFSWSQTVRISWHFNPNSCTFYYSIGGGPCGSILAD
jgi:hypothetical protein